jgi:hypothetical protein
LPPRVRVLTPIQEELACAQAASWLQTNIIEPAPPSAPWCNNLVFVAKKDGRVRVCLDCTPSNLQTKDYDWPLPRLQDLRYRIRGFTWFARIDLSDAFFRIRVPSRYRHLVRFRVKGAVFQFRKMPFGLKTAPATFQRFMDHGLAQHSAIAYWYMDDILIGATSPDELAAREGAVRRTLAAMQCTVNEAKSVTQQTQLLFAGLWIMGAGVGPNLAKVREVLSIPAPRTKAEAQSAMGLVSYLRDFIPLIGHFTSMLYPDQHGLRLPTAEYEVHWGRLLRHLASACTINHHWREGVPADVYTDASQTALGAIVIQEGRIAAVGSRKLTGAETRYSATDREHLALVYLAERFKLILHQSQQPVRVWTDHSALLTRRKDRLTPRQARWEEVVSNWIPRLAHVKGKENPADFISRWGASSVGAILRV